MKDGAPLIDAALNMVQKTGLRGRCEMNSMEASGAFSEPFVKATTVKSDYARGFADARKRDQELLEWAKNHIAEVEEINRDLRQELNRMKMVATAGIGSLILLCLLWVTVR